MRRGGRVPDQVADIRRGKWNKAEYSKARGLYGRTLGIVGLGQIGREVASRARAFGMRVLAWSRTLTHEEADRLGIAYAHNPLEVARLVTDWHGQGPIDLPGGARATRSGEHVVFSMTGSTDVVPHDH